MRNVTITLDDETALWARLEAAKRDTSVSRLVGELLRQHMDHELAYDHARRSWERRQGRALRREIHPFPDRDELHTR